MAEKSDADGDVDSLEPAPVGVRDVRAEERDDIAPVGRCEDKRIERWRLEDMMTNQNW